MELNIKGMNYVPLKSGNVNRFAEKDCVVVQASLNLGSQLARQKEWIPGPWLTLERLIKTGNG